MAITKWRVRTDHGFLKRFTKRARGRIVFPGDWRPEDWYGEDRAWEIAELVGATHYIGPNCKKPEHNNQMNGGCIRITKTHQCQACQSSALIENSTSGS